MRISLELINFLYLNRNTPNEAGIELIGIELKGPCDFGGLHADLFYEALQNRIIEVSQLRWLKLNAISKRAVSVIMPCLAINTNVTTLGLANLTPEAAMAVVSELSKTQVTQLGLGNLTPEAAKAVVSELGKTQVTRLVLGNLSPEAAMAIMRNLPNTRVEELTLVGLSRDAVQAIVGCLDDYTSIKLKKLILCGLPLDICETIYDGLTQKNPCITIEKCACGNPIEWQPKYDEFSHAVSHRLSSASAAAESQERSPDSNRVGIKREHDDSGSGNSSRKSSRLSLGTSTSSIVRVLGQAAAARQPQSQSPTPPSAVSDSSSGRSSPSPKR